MRLREFGEIRHGNVLLVPCMGRKPCGVEHCCGMIRIPFEPTIGGAPLAKPTGNGLRWHRTSGETLDDLTLEQSVQADKCGHFTIKNGELTIQA